MAEDEIVCNVCEYISNSGGIDWFSISATIIPVIALIFTILHFNKSQKNMQIKFNQTQLQTNQLAFIQRIERYEDSFLELSREYIESPQMAHNCARYANRWLLLLDRLAFFKLRGLVDDDFIQFFELRFKLGMQYRDWLVLMHGTDPKYVDLGFSSFTKLKDTLSFMSDGVTMDTSFRYYRYRKRQDSNYDPSTDDFDAKFWKDDSTN